MRHIEDRVVALARAVHEPLAQAEDAAAANAMVQAALRAQAGVDWEEEEEEEEDTRKVSDQQAKATQPATAHPPRVTLAQVSQHLATTLGHSVRVGPSTIPHQEAGRGLFMVGEARAGAVVALVPGVVYARTQLTHMPHYPKVDLDNDMLSSRYDYTIVDSKPWGVGSQQEGVSGGSGGAWPVVTSPAAHYLSTLEGRHPLALGHLVNHPAQGMAPNVLEVAFDLDLGAPEYLDAPWLRAYMPNAPWLDEGIQDAARALLVAGGWRGKDRRLGGRSPPSVRSAGGRVRGLALVAVRTLRDGEEVLQDYRLNPAAIAPDWYVAHNAEEAARRWAKPRYASLLV